MIKQAGKAGTSWVAAMGLTGRRGMALPVKGTDRWKICG
jgi:hypothetical protein